MPLPPAQAADFANSRVYQSPPGSGGNDGALPTVFVPWSAAKLFSNLTPAQTLAFQAFPQNLLSYSSDQRWQAEQTGSGQTSATITPINGTATVIPINTDDRSKMLLIGMRQSIDDGLMTQVPFKDANGNFWLLDVANAKIAHQAVQGFVGSLFSTEATLAAGINATPPTVTTRKAIDAAYAAIAPKSPSSVNPSST